MPGFKQGDKIRVKGQSSSPFHGRIGTVVRSYIYGLALVYEVTFDQLPIHMSRANKFFAYDLEFVGSS